MASYSNSVANIAFTPPLIIRAISCVATVYRETVSIVKSNARLCCVVVFADCNFSRFIQQRSDLLFWILNHGVHLTTQWPGSEKCSDGTYFDAEIQCITRWL